MLRLFLAIQVSPDVREMLASIREDLTGIRWVDPARYHLTLRFIGDVADNRVPLLVTSLGRVAFEPVQIRLDRLGAFPSLDAPRVLFAHVAPDESLLDLQGGIERAVVACGFDAEDRPFRPHVTLARLRGASARTVYNLVRKISLDTTFTATTFSLYQSVLDPSGARHIALATFPARRG